MYFVTTFYQMWRYRLLMREHLRFKERPKAPQDSPNKIPEQSHTKAIEGFRSFQRSYYLERRPFV